MSEEQKPKTVEEAANEIKAAAWNACIVPRLDALRTWLRHPEWNEGVRAYLLHQKEMQFKLLVKGNTNALDDKYVIGRISMLMEILDLPLAIENNIVQRENIKSRPHPQGEAGY